MISFIIFVGLGYLMGSISSAVIVSRVFSLPDPRQEGSKNPGATNVLRLAGKRYAALVLLADLLKGLIPVVLAKIFDASPVVVSFTALAAVLGHMFPVFFEFKGGKGVATAIGALLGFHLLLGVLAVLTWVVVAKFTRYSSLASIVSICLSPLYSLLLLDGIETFPPLFFIALFVLYKHNENISRLVKGTENKMKFKKDDLLDEIVPDPIPMNAHELDEPTKKTVKTKAKKTQVIKKTKPKTVKTAETKAKTAEIKKTSKKSKASKPKGQAS